MDGNGEGTSGEDGFRLGGVTNLVVEYCNVHDYPQRSSQWHNDCFQFPSGTNATFRYNRISNCGQLLFVGDCTWGGQYVNGINIHHNVFYNPSGHGSYNGIAFKGINKNGNYTTKVENNTFAIRTSSGGGSAVYDTPSCTTSTNTQNRYFHNNILYDSSSGQATNSTHSHNNYYLTSTPLETGSITTNPLFTNYSGNDFTLQENSPVIGAGIDLGYSNDALGKQVPKNPSMGAYEFESGEPTSTALLPPENLRVVSVY
jgi:hypothetical protein